jgi:hypothetical protein
MFFRIFFMTASQNIGWFLRTNWNNGFQRKKKKLIDTGLWFFAGFGLKLNGG